MPDKDNSVNFTIVNKVNIVNTVNINANFVNIVNIALRSLETFETPVCFFRSKNFLDPRAFFKVQKVSKVFQTCQKYQRTSRQQLCTSGL